MQVKLLRFGTVMALLLATIFSAAGYARAGQADPSSEATTKTLIDADLTLLELPVSIDQLVIARWSLEPGAEREVPGTSIFVVESGTLTTQTSETMRVYGDPSTPGPVHQDTVTEQLGTLNAGDQLVVTDDFGTGVQLSNEKTSVATGLSVGLFREDQGLTSSEGFVFTPIVNMVGGPSLQDYTVILDRLSFPNKTETTLTVPANAFGVLVNEIGILNMTPDGTTNHSSAKNAGEITQRVPTEHFNLLSGDWLASGPGSMLTRNVERGASTALMLTLIGEEHGGDPATTRSGLQLGSLLSVSIDIPTNATMVEVARHSLEPGDRIDGGEGAGALALSVEAGQVDIEVVGQATRRQMLAGVEGEDQLLEPGTNTALVAGDQVILNDSSGFTLVNSADSSASILELNIGQALSAPLTSTDGQAVRTSILVGELPAHSAGSFDIEIGRFQLEPGQSRGPVSIDLGPVFMAVEEGSLVLEVTDGSGKVWPDAAEQSVSFDASSPLERAVDQGTTMLLDKGFAGTLSNNGDETVVIMTLSTKKV